MIEENKYNQYLIMKKGMLIILASAALTITACDSSKESAEFSSDDSSYSESSNSESYDSMNNASYGDLEDSSEVNNSGSEDKVAVENLDESSELELGSQTSDIEVEGKTLLINASADFEVEDVVKTRAAIETLTRQHKGYIASSNIESHEVSSKTFNQQDKVITLVTYYRQAHMQVRIPKQQVSTFFNQLQSQVTYLNTQNFSAQDVTLDLYREKLKSQLNAEMAGELNQQRLDSDNEKEQDSNIDSIEAKYSAKQRQQIAEIERLTIADKVKYSTIELTFRQPNSIYKISTDSVEYMISTEQPSFWEQVKQSLIDGWEMIKQVVLALISFWWIALLVIIVAMFYYLMWMILNKFDKKSQLKKDTKRQVTDNDDFNNLDES